MPTFSLTNFDHPAATDFLDEFRDDPSEVLLLEALVTAAEADGSLETDEAAAALAAAEVVAAWLGEPSPALPPELEAVVDDLDISDEEELTDLARRAVQAVLHDSELREQWQASGRLPQWQTVQEDVLKRLE
ncbi:DUF4259 domain-containing protein [Hymenobacter weizhouensis]|uniref:DUF4259 domain-containing protein n=1 Tax=Hymenobacter sp. YIM 151500-1 TaxID=2987689 RepID=UPI002226EDC2|nr:DUF4259 domain-containing protein [Hymenobacter sp. YIM 151500-1]UYZ64079.1 DUF4259 domain-containing protein [Hymenobacter sp. YIM 151500-1]